MLNSMLESQVQQRTAQLEKALDDLSDFTYSVAHNLRAPLRGMIGNSRIIFEDYAGDVSSGLKKKLRAVESNALKLAGLIDDLLAFAQLNRTEMAPVMLELSELVEETPDRLKQQGKQFGAVELTVQPNMTASADRSMVEDLFEILIGNAIKYKSAGGPAKVGVGQKDGVFFVHDEGIGFDPEYAGRLFKPFERLHRDGEYAGNGIGLANAKRIVERHGGEIRSTGRIDHGATFYFTLSGHLPERTD